MSETKFTRTIEFTPAFDKRNPNPSKNYGIHGMEMVFLLKGEHGVIQFVVYTNWMLPHVQKELDLQHHDHLFCHPTAADIGYHSYIPRYEGQESMTDECTRLDGKPCYYDGSSLNAEPILAKLIAEGEQAVWKEMEGWYERNLMPAKAEGK